MTVCSYAWPERLTLFFSKNRLVECDPNFCPCGSSCQNQKFQSKEYAKLDIKRTGKKGHGLFTKQPLRKGQFIIEYVGEVLHEVRNFPPERAPPSPVPDCAYSSFPKGRLVPREALPRLLTRDTDTTVILLPP